MDFVLAALRRTWMCMRRNQNWCFVAATAILLSAILRYPFELVNCLHITLIITTVLFVIILYLLYLMKRHINVDRYVMWRLVVGYFGVFLLGLAIAFLILIMGEVDPPYSEKLTAYVNTAIAYLVAMTSMLIFLVDRSIWSFLSFGFWFLHFAYSVAILGCLHYGDQDSNVNSYRLVAEYTTVMATMVPIMKGLIDGLLFPER